MASQPQDEEIRLNTKRLLDNVPSDGRAVGNVHLMRTLHWDAEKYWAVRDALINEGVLETGRGRGGSVHLARPDKAAVANESPKGRVKEGTLYEPMLQVIRESWVADKQLRDSIAWVSARGGSQPTGKWGRPDITVLARRTFPFYPGNFWDIHTFEIKPSDLFDVTAVYEALAHRRAATHSWVLALLPGVEPTDEGLQAVAAEAKRYGIGLIIAGKADVFETWDDSLADAERHEPDPQAASEFLKREAHTDLKLGDQIQDLLRR